MILASALLLFSLVSLTIFSPARVKSGFEWVFSWFQECLESVIIWQTAIINKFQHIAYTPSLQWYMYFVQKLYKTLKRRIHPLLKMLAKKAWLCLLAGTTPTITGSTTIATPTHHYIHYNHHTYPLSDPPLSSHPPLSPDPPHLPIATSIITTPTYHYIHHYHHTYTSPYPPHLPITTSITITTSTIKKVLLT